MASIIVPKARAVFLAAGGADGVVQVADNSAFYQYAECWLTKADGTGNILCQIVSTSGSDKVTFRPVVGYPNYQRVNLTAYLAGSTIDQPEQAVRLEVMTQIQKAFPNIAPVASIQFDDLDENITVAGAEELVIQGVLDFNAIPSATMKAMFQGLVRSAAGDATLKVKYGGTDGLPDGTTVITYTINGAAFVAVNPISTVAKPAGLQLVKVTLQSSGAAVEAAVKSSIIKFQGV